MFAFIDSNLVYKINTILIVCVYACFFQCSGAGVPAPLGAVDSFGNLDKRATEGQTREEWLAMAKSSGWTSDMPQRKAVQAAFDSLLLNLPSQLAVR